MFKILKFISSLLLFAAPLSVSAAGLTNILDAAYKLVDEILLPLAFAACVFYFFFGIYKYIWSSAGSERAAEEGRRIMLAGIIGLFVAFSIWGIIKFLQAELGLPPVQQNVRVL